MKMVIVVYEDSVAAVGNLAKGQKVTLEGIANGEILAIADVVDPPSTVVDGIFHIASVPVPES